MKTPEEQQVVRNVLNLKQTAEYLGVSRGWMYAHLSEIPRYTVGAKVLFLRAAIDQWLMEKSQASIAKGETKKEIAERKASEILSGVRR
jgi:excisionase family DNA binding protein